MVADSELDRDRDDHGRFWADRDRDDLLDTMEPGEPYTTGELVESTGWPRRTVFKALDELADEGKLRKKKPNPTSAIWMLTAEG